MINKRTNVHSKKKKGIDTDAIILENRIVFIYNDITDELALNVIKELIALDIISHKPITIMMNTQGGSCESGLAIIDTIQRVESKVITFINGMVCSMGTHIALAGDIRWATKHSSWMNHDLSDYIWDTSQKIKDRAVFLEKYSNIFVNQMKAKTKLTSKDFKKAKNSELWLIGDELLEKGIVDAII